ncbi:MAG: hypothetical protein KGI27_09345 [Thaumarchaeota archaeon]|nr:hypothetical protein [Nitrososphaerota archaeon]
MTKIKNKFKSGSKILMLVLPVLVILSGLSLYHPSQVQSKEPTNEEIMNMMGKMITPSVNVVGSLGELGVPLTEVRSSDDGEAISSNVGSTFPQVIHDNSHLKLTLYEGKYPNGTRVIAITATNIGTQQLVLDRLYIGGSIPGYGKANSTINVLQAHTVGCTTDFNFVENVKKIYPNGTSTLHPETMKYICQNPSVLGNTTLNPGQSLNAYIKGTFVASNMPINIFGADAGYIVEGTNRLFLVGF